MNYSADFVSSRLKTVSCKGEARRSPAKRIMKQNRKIFFFFLCDMNDSADSNFCPTAESFKQKINYETKKNDSADFIFSQIEEIFIGKGEARESHEAHHE